MTINLSSKDGLVGDEDFLRDVQANIFKSHGRAFAWHVFIQFDASKKEKARKWVSELEFSTAQAQLENARKRREWKQNGTLATLDGGLVRLFMLSKNGFDALGASREGLTDSYFSAGMKDESLAKTIGDEPEKWENPFQNDIHALLILADSDKERLLEAFKKHENELHDFGKILLCQKGQTLERDGFGIEHFGYVDGVSQPIFLKNEIDEARGKLKIWDPSAAPDLALVEHAGSFGSYFTFRKLEQNVRDFKAAEVALAEKLWGNASEMTGALIVGRFEDGTPISLFSDELGLKKGSEVPNDFDHSDDGGAAPRCPFHSHIRKTNPRKHGGGDFSTQRIVRRGIPYDDFGRENLEQEPVGEVGLLFMCYQKSIENQFVNVQKGFAGVRNFPPENETGADALLFGRAELGWKNAHQNSDEKADFGQFVTMRGGEHFFAPSIGFLKNLGAELVFARAEKSSFLGELVEKVDRVMRKNLS